MPSPFSAEAYRKLFPILERATCLDACSCGAPALPVLRAIDNFMRDWGAMGPQWEEGWYDAVLGAEEQFALLIGADTDEVVFLPNVSVALATIASAFHAGTLPSWGGRTRCLIPEDEFPTTGHIWLHQRVHGLEVVKIPADSDDLTPFLGNDSLMVALSHVNYSTGRRRNLPAIIAQARQAGALVILDDSQSAGTRQINVAALGIDMLVTSGHKYLLGLPGAGAFLYVRQELISRLEPLGVGWAAHRDFVRSIEQRHGQLTIVPGTEGWDPFSFELAGDAWRFSGGTANIVGACAARAGLSLVRDMDPASVATHVDRLSALLIEGCQGLGLPLKTPLPPEQRGPMVVIGCSDPAALTAHLAEQQIKVSPRGTGVRLSLHGYNIEDDVRLVLAALSATHWLFSPTRMHSVPCTT